MARIPKDLFRDWNDGETITEAEYEREREIIRTAINDNYERLLERYTKAEIDSLLSYLGSGMAISVRTQEDFPAELEGALVLKKPENHIYYRIGDQWEEVATADDIAEVVQSLQNHLDDKSNPHNVTVEQIGAIDIGQKGQPNGLATLDSNGLLSQLVNSFKTDVKAGSFSHTFSFTSGYLDKSINFTVPYKRFYIFFEENGNLVFFDRNNPTYSIFWNHINANSTRSMDITMGTGSGKISGSYNDAVRLKEISVSSNTQLRFTFHNDTGNNTYTVTPSFKYLAW